MNFKDIQSIIRTDIVDLFVIMKEFLFWSINHPFILQLPIMLTKKKVHRI